MASFQAERYAQLINELGEQMAHRYGWKAATARILQVHPSYISKVLKGEINSIGGEVIGKAVQALSLNPDFFMDEGAEAKARHHSEFVIAAEAERKNTALREANPLAPESIYGPEFREVKSALLRFYSSADYQQTAAGTRTEFDIYEARKLAEAVLALPLVAAARDIIERAAGDHASVGSALVLAKHVSSLVMLVDREQRLLRRTPNGPNNHE